MSFEKEFPSLTKEEYSEEKGRWYEEQQIKNTCIDKQRVKEVILNSLQDHKYITKEELAGVIFKEFNIK